MDGCLELINSLLSATLPWQVSKLKELGGGGEPQDSPFVVKPDQLWCFWSYCREDRAWLEPARCSGVAELPCAGLGSGCTQAPCEHLSCTCGGHCWPADAAERVTVVCSATCGSHVYLIIIIIIKKVKVIRYSSLQGKGVVPARSGPGVVWGGTDGPAANLLP